MKWERMLMYICFSKMNEDRNLQDLGIQMGQVDFVTIQEATEEIASGMGMLNSCWKNDSKTSLEMTVRQCAHSAAVPSSWIQTGLRLMVIDESMIT